MNAFPTQVSAEMSSEKFYAAAVRPHNPQQQGAQQAAAKAVEGQQKESGVNWETAEDGDRRINIDYYGDKLAIHSSTLSASAKPTTFYRTVLSGIAGAREQLSQFKGKLIAKLLQGYDESVRGAHHWSAPNAGFSKFMSGIYSAGLARLGFEVSQLEERRSAIRQEMQKEVTSKLYDCEVTAAYTEDLRMC
jgi:hypothetical protein